METRDRATDVPLSTYCGDHNIYEEIESFVIRNYRLKSLKDEVNEIKKRKHISVGFTESNTSLDNQSDKFKVKVPNLKLQDLRDLNEVVQTKRSSQDDLYREIGEFEKLPSWSSVSFNNNSVSQQKLSTPVKGIGKLSLDRSKTAGCESSDLNSNIPNGTLSKKNNQLPKLGVFRSKTDTLVNSYQKSELLGTVVQLNNRSILLLRFGREVIACDSRCPHKGADLNLGDIEMLASSQISSPNINNNNTSSATSTEGGRIKSRKGDRLLKCCWHNFQFNLDQSGWKYYPATQLTGMHLQMYEVHVIEEGDDKGDIYVEFPELYLNFDI